MRYFHSKSSLLIILPIFLLFLILSDCGKEEKKVTAAITYSYPAALSESSTPSDVAQVLIKGLDEGDNKTLIGLVAKESIEEIDAMTQKLRGNSKPKEGSGVAMIVAGWKMTCSFSQPSSTQVVNEDISGDNAIVYLLAHNATTGAEQHLEVKMVREEGLWKVKAGIETN